MQHDTFGTRSLSDLAGTEPGEFLDESRVWGQPLYQFLWRRSPSTPGKRRPTSDFPAWLVLVEALVQSALSQAQQLTADSFFFRWQVVVEPHSAVLPARF